MWYVSRVLKTLKSSPVSSPVSSPEAKKRVKTDKSCCVHTGGLMCFNWH